MAQVAGVVVSVRNRKYWQVHSLCFEINAAAFRHDQRVLDRPGHMPEEFLHLLLRA